MLQRAKSKSDNSNNDNVHALTRTGGDAVSDSDMMGEVEGGKGIDAGERGLSSS